MDWADAEGGRAQGQVAGQLRLPELYGQLAGLELVDKLDGVAGGVGGARQGCAWRWGATWEESRELDLTLFAFFFLFF